MTTASLYRIGRSLWLASTLSAVAIGCGAEHPGAPVGGSASAVRVAAFVNGDFETGAIGSVPASWTVQTNLNPSITDTTIATPPGPQTLASLNLAAGGYAATLVVGGTPTESQTDPDLGVAASLRYPRYGLNAARVNYLNATGAGNGTLANVNVLRQTMTIANGDVDASDNKAHVRFVIAPVLQNGGHPYTQQPYYYVQLQNLTKAKTLYQDFNISAQPGVPWKLIGIINYTDWQLVDIAPGNAALAVGDQVELVVVASGCSPGGHWGRVYVDGVGASIPGIYTYATGPSAANAGSNITYVLNYKNGGTTPVATTKIDIVIPTNTTFQSVSLPGACTTPAIGATGTVTCTLGSLAQGSGGSFTLTVKIATGTTGTITNGDYDIYATGTNTVNPLLGPKVLTTVTSGVTYADVAITKTDGVAAVGFGQPITYTIQASNAGPSTAAVVTVADSMPAQISGVSWTCVGGGGGSCTASGSGSISDGAVSLPVGGTATYTVQATVMTGTGTGSIINTATATVGGGASDPSTGNNTAVDTDSIGVLQTLTLTKTGAAGGTVATVPASISCGATCTGASGSFVNGTQVVLSATAVAGGSFSGWGGACLSAGTSPTCNLTMTANMTVTAAFVPPPTISVSSGNNQSAAINTAFAAHINALVVDSGGNPLAGTTVVFSVPASGASATLGASTATTNAAGIASVTVTANATAGAYQVTAGIMGTAASTSFSLSNYGVPASVSVVSGGGQSAAVGAAFASGLVVVVRDAVSQIVPGATVTFAAPTSGARATLSSASLVTDATGQATITATAGQIAGSYAVTASVSGVTLAASFALTNSAGSGVNIAATAGGGQSATVGNAFGTALAVTVTDTFGNPVAGVTVTFTAPTSGARATLSVPATTSATGQTSVTATANTAAGGYTVTASAPAVTTPASFALTNNPGPAASLVATSGGGQAALTGTVFAAPLVATVKDSSGNPISGASVVFSTPGAGASAALAPSPAPTNVAGQTNVAATANATAGAYTISASVAGVAAPVTFALTNYAPLLLAPATVTVAPRGSRGFTASGGQGAYVYTLATNASGGVINASTGAYSAGPTPNVTDVVRVTDAAAATATATVTIGAGVSISPTSAAVAPRGAKTFTASGGSGTGLTFTLSINGSGGSINASSGAYLAGATAGATDVVTVTDSLGNAATATVTVGGGVGINPTSAAVAPRGTKTFTASGGSGTGFSFTLTTSGSGGNVNAASGVYTAGATPNATDVVTVTDSLGNTATASISVGGGLSISPSSTTVAPRGTKTFTASGGSGAGITFSLTTNGSGGTVNAASGAYVAGPTPSVIDVVKVTDSLGNSASATITVGAGVVLLPATASVPPQGSVMLSASGGSGAGFVFSISVSHSGASVDGSGKYTAGPTGSVVDVVTVADSVGNSATSTITVGPVVAIQASGSSSPPRGALTFTPAGGSGVGYSFTFSTNASGATINGSTGAYTAGSKPDVTDVILLTDSLGNIAAVNVAVGDGVSVTPPAPVVAPHGSLNLVASGGSGLGFLFTLTANLSGGTINATTGVYAAGGLGSTVDLVTVTDSLGNSVAVSISVGGGLAVSPATTTVSPRQSATFAAAGGSGVGFAFALTSNGSGGVVDPASGAYTAGSLGGVSDVLTVTDSLGNSAISTITVGPGIQVGPASATLAPLGQQSFSVSGGSGAGYSFTLSTNASGGSINATTGAYVAGAAGSVTDVITTTDSFGNTASVLVTITAALQPAATQALPPRGSATLAVTGGAGSYSFAVTVNGSGGSVDPLSGNYVAGSVGNTTDLITVTDGNGVTAVISIAIGPGVSIAPATPAVAPRGVLTFTASGGSGAGYRYTLAASPSGGQIDPASGLYLAGPIAAVIDVVAVTDSLGNTASLSISVGNGLVLAPATSAVAPRAAIAFNPIGGSGSGYVYALVSNLSGGAIDTATGAYTAGGVPNVTDVVEVTDSLGNTAMATVTVGNGVFVTPASASTVPQGTVALSASGGSGAGYAFAVTTNASGGSVDPSTGRYQAGLIPSVTDSVTVTDSLGNTAIASIFVGAGITLTASANATPPRGTLALTATGGSGSYTFSIRSNGSGGSIVSTTGVYTAGAIGNTADMLVATDSLGNFATLQIAVGAGIAITPSAPVVPPGGTLTFVASGGSGAGDVFALTTNGSGGVVDPSSGVYVAGPVSNVDDVVTVTDSFGNVGAVNIVVGNGVGLSPHAPTVPPRGTVQFTAVGGSGAGYVFTLGAAPSGGAIDASSGLYKAGSTPNVTDQVTVADSLGKTATVQVTVGPGVAIAPAATNVSPLSMLAFSVTGGSGGGYQFTFASNGSGGMIDAALGSYRAGAVGGTTDLIRVTDALGNGATATISVGAALTGTLSTGTVPPGGTAQVMVTGGAGPYSYALSTDKSGGNVNPTTGQYTAGSTGNTVDVITVTDVNGVSTTITVTVGPGITIGPASPTVAAGGNVHLTASGGSGSGYTWRLTDASGGGTVDPATGVYTGPHGSATGGTDVVQVTDSLGNTASVSIKVTATGATFLSGGASGCGCQTTRTPPLGLGTLFGMVALILTSRRRRHQAPGVRR
jgi:MYXO-CTERM domain-containing protein